MFGRFVFRRSNLQRKFLLQVLKSVFCQTSVFLANIANANTILGACVRVNRAVLQSRSKWVRWWISNSSVSVNFVGVTVTQLLSHMLFTIVIWINICQIKAVFGDYNVSSTSVICPKRCTFIVLWKLLNTSNSLESVAKILKLWWSQEVTLWIVLTAGTHPFLPIAWHRLPETDVSGREHHSLNVPLPVAACLCSHPARLPPPLPGRSCAVSHGPPLQRTGWPHQTGAATGGANTRVSSQQNGNFICVFFQY